jgi:hypothetical protein
MQVEGICEMTRRQRKKRIKKDLFKQLEKGHFKKLIHLYYTILFGQKGELGVKFEVKLEVKKCDYCKNSIDECENIYLLADGAIVHCDCLRDYLVRYAEKELMPIEVVYEEGV